MINENILKILVYTLEAFSIIIIIWGVLVQFFKFIRIQLKSKSNKDAVEKITDLKNFLATYILFALEVLIGADIIESIIDPTIDHIVSLAAIVIIRTIISYFLNKEIESSNNQSQSNNNQNQSSNNQQNK